MADQKIGPPGQSREVEIPEHTAARRAQGLRVRLAAAAAEEYEVWQKEMPAELPERYEGRPITWFNNFGLKRKGKDAYEVSVPAYTIIVAKYRDDAILVAYEDQPEPRLYALETVEVDGELQATLDRGDPTVGWG